MPDDKAEKAGEQDYSASCVLYDAAVLSTDAMYLIAPRFRAGGAAHARLPTLRYTCFLYDAAILSMTCVQCDCL